MSTRLYSTGRYGVVDPFYRHIWINLWDEEIAHMIREVFWSKTTSLVFDLEQFSNFTESTVDSDVCLDWKIPLGPVKSKINNIAVHWPHVKDTQSEYFSNVLINEPNHSHLPRTQLVDLQQQMLLYCSLVNRYKQIWHHEIDPTDLTSVNQVFQKNLNLENIKTGLYKLTDSIPENKFSISWAILSELDCLYE